MLSKNNLSKEQCNFRVEKSSKVELRWRKRFEDLKVYKARFGNCNVPRNWKQNPSLGHWVHDQRKQIRRWKLGGSRLSKVKNHYEDLNSIGFEWNLQTHSLSKTWDERFEELKQYSNFHGNCNVPIRWSQNRSLGQWVSTQRYQYAQLKRGKPSKMTKEHATRLESLGFTWSLRKRVNNMKKKVLGKYVEIHKNNFQKGVCKTADNIFSHHWVLDETEQSKLAMAANISEIPSSEHLIKFQATEYSVRKSSRSGKKEISISKNSTNEVQCAATNDFTVHDCASDYESLFDHFFTQLGGCYDYADNDIVDDEELDFLVQQLWSS